MSSLVQPSLSARASLIGLCVECQESYQPTRVTPFAHLAHFARVAHSQLSQPAHSAELDFVSDVFLGMQRLHELLDITADGLYATQAAQLARRDRTLHLVCLLLLLDRLARVGWDEVAAYLRCQPPHCVLPLLTFLFDTALQDGWMRQQWQTVYDAAHVDGRLLHTLRRHQRQAEALMDRLAAQLQSERQRRDEMAALAGEAAAHSNAHQAVTVPQPFTLSQSKPKALPAPIALTTGYIAREVPAAVTRSHSLQQIEQQRQQRRQATREQTARALNSAAQPTLATSQRPTGLPLAQQRMEERLREDTKQLSFARAVPATLHTADPEAATHKPTAASILREEDRYRRERAEEAERLLRFECELRDEAAFQRWQSAKRADDQQRRKEDIARRKHVMAQAQHDAQVSVQRMVQLKQQQASGNRDDIERQLHERQTEEEAQRRRREEAVKQRSVAEDEAVQASLAELRRRKREAAAALTAESRQLSGEREARLEEERAERRRLLLRIQAMEKLATERAKRTTVVEESSTGGLNLLSDMSIAEMRVRLILLEEADRLHVERKRERIEADKRTRAAVLSAMQQQHSAIRANNSAQKEADRQHKRAGQQREAEQVQAKLAEEGRDTAARMDERRKEVIAAAVAIAAQVSSNKQLADRLQVEAERSRQRALSDMTATAERRASKDRQRMDRQRRLEEEADGMKAADLSRVRTAAKQHTEQRRDEANRRLEEAVEGRRKADGDERSAHSSQRGGILEQRQRLRRTVAASNPFASHASELDVQRGRQAVLQSEQAEERWRAKQRAALEQQTDRAGPAAAEEKEQLTDRSSTAPQQSADPHVGSAVSIAATAV